MIAQAFGNGADEMRVQLDRLFDFSKLLEQGATLLMDSQKKNIEESRSPDGEPYPPLKSARPTRLGAGIADGWGGEIIRRRVEQHPYAHKPLLDTTNMYQSIHFEILNDHEAFIGPSLVQAPYFPYQNQGAPRRSVPAREFIGIRVEDNTDLEEIVVVHTSTALAA